MALKSEQKSQETQTTIIDAARKIFTQKGLEGARMQEIADEAGINKALVHYYYRSKDKLFEQVFISAFKELAEPLAKFLADDSDLFQKIRNISRHYHTSLAKHPLLPNFILNEVNRNPDRVYGMLVEKGIKEGGQKTMMQILGAVNSGEIRMIDPRELVLNIISLCVFPFSARHIISKMLYDGSDVEKVLISRADYVADFVIHSIKIKNE